MAAPENLASETLITLLNETYAAEGFVARKDKLHKSLGDQKTEIGVYPDQTTHAKVALIGEMRLIVQFYGKYKKEVNREQRVDPGIVVNYADRFRKKIQVARGMSHPATGEFWYFNVERTIYPPDPTDNQTRYEMQIRAFGNNTALVESV